MRRIFFSIVLAILHQVLLAQTGKVQSCSTDKVLLSAQLADNGYTVFTAYYSDKNTTDTLQIAPFPLGSLEEGSCACNDTVATFFIYDPSLPTLVIFIFTKGKWKFNDVLGLPPKFPLVGVLIDGWKYERYSHRLISPTELISDLTVLTANKQKLTPVEHYTIEYKIAMKLATPKPRMIKTYDCKLLVVKKIARDK